MQPVIFCCARERLISIFFNKRLKALLTLLCGHPYTWVNNNYNENKLFPVTFISNLIRYTFILFIDTQICNLTLDNKCLLQSKRLVWREHKWPLHLETCLHRYWLRTLLFADWIQKNLTWCYHGIDLQPSGGLTPCLLSITQTQKELKKQKM